MQFAKLQGNLNDEVAQTISIMHGFRNEVYHVGLQHEAILSVLAVFYFDVACRFAGTYEPRGLGWGSSQQLPERSKKYFHGDAFFPGSPGDFAEGCAVLAQECCYNGLETITVLADHLDSVISDQDTCIDVIAGGVYKGQQTTRDKAVIDLQTWRLAFTKDGQSFAKENGWTGDNMLRFVDWLAETYPLKFRGDPISTWQKRARTG